MAHIVMRITDTSWLRVQATEHPVGRIFFLPSFIKPRSKFQTAKPFFFTHTHASMTERVARYMATAPADVNRYLLSVTGATPPNTLFMPEDLHAMAASRLLALSSEVKAARCMLLATGGKQAELKELEGVEEVLARIGNAGLATREK